MDNLRNSTASPGPTDEQEERKGWRERLDHVLTTAIGQVKLLLPVHNPNADSEEDEPLEDKGIIFGASYLWGKEEIYNRKYCRQWDTVTRPDGILIMRLFLQ